MIRNILPQMTQINTDEFNCTEVGRADKLFNYPIRRARIYLCQSVSSVAEKIRMTKSFS